MINPRDAEEFCCYGRGIWSGQDGTVQHECDGSPVWLVRWEEHAALLERVAALEAALSPERAA